MLDATRLATQWPPFVIHFHATASIAIPHLDHPIERTAEGRPIFSELEGQSCFERGLPEVLKDIVSKALAGWIKVNRITNVHYAQQAEAVVSLDGHAKFKLPRRCLDCMRPQAIMPASNKMTCRA